MPVLHMAYWDAIKVTTTRKMHFHWIVLLLSAQFVCIEMHSTRHPRVSKSVGTFMQVIQNDVPNWFRLCICLPCKANALLCNFRCFVPICVVFFSFCSLSNWLHPQFLKSFVCWKTLFIFIETLIDLNRVHYEWTTHLTASQSTIFGTRRGDQVNSSGMLLRIRRFKNNTFDTIQDRDFSWEGKLNRQLHNIVCMLHSLMW